MPGVGKGEDEVAGKSGAEEQNMETSGAGKAEVDGDGLAAGLLVAVEIAQVVDVQYGGGEQSRAAGRQPDAWGQRRGLQVVAAGNAE